MSLANENDIIVPNTTGIITALGREANQYREADLAKCIRATSIVYRITSQRAKGISLDQLVNPGRISSDKSRVENQQQQSKITDEDKERVYESWFRE